ncbi:MAG: hypothetical protein FK733_14480 [Asgard group archaeon]|nr:hypothetical protein [Asgard group archaeon]
MKRINKVLLVLVVVGLLALSFSFQGAESTFNISVGQKLYYKIEKSRVSDVSKALDDLSIQTLYGFELNSEVYPEGETVQVEVLNISGESILWQISVGGNAKNQSTQASATNAGFDLMLGEPSSTTSYLAPFLIPPILGNSSANWDSLQSVYNYYVNYYLDVYSTLSAHPDLDYVVFTYAGTYVEELGLAKLTYSNFLSNRRVLSSTSQGVVASRVDSFAHYNLTTGILDRYEIRVEDEVIVMTEYNDPLIGTYFIAFTDSSITESKVTRVAPPDTPSALAEFLAENKWYFVEGGVALGALAIAIPTTAIVVKRKDATGKKKTTKKKSKSKSKKRKSKR